VSEVTRILDSLEQGKAGAADELLPLVYDEQPDGVFGRNILNH